MTEVYFSKTWSILGYHDTLSKILYSLQQRLVQNQAKLSEKTLVAKMSGIWQQSTQKTALTVKKMRTRKGKILYL